MLIISLTITFISNKIRIIYLKSNFKLQFLLTGKMNILYTNLLLMSINEMENFSITWERF